MSVVRGQLWQTTDNRQLTIRRPGTTMTTYLPLPVSCPLSVVRVSCSRQPTTDN
ncbi:hypothetical protein QUF72_18815 [Desulfobacterales bacterium HSG2]|nr:hypothetical protein [Desulfobacterales bacterium HSG2]